MTDRRWSGVLARLGGDLKADLAGDPIHMDLPFPLSAQDSQNPWSDPVGTVEAVWIDGDDVRATGVLTGRPFDALPALLAGETVPVRVHVWSRIRDGGNWKVAQVQLGEEAVARPGVGIALDPA